MQRTTIGLVLCPPMWRIMHDQEDRNAMDNNPPRLGSTHHTIWCVVITEQLQSRPYYTRTTAHLNKELRITHS